jgi:phage terminase large subunit-like protein
VPGPTPWISPAALDDQRALLPESSYRRLHLNRWVAAEDRLTSLEALRECVTLDGPLRPEHGVQYVVAVDIGLKNDRTVAAVCHAEPIDDRNPATWAASGDLSRDRERSDVVSITDWYGRRDAPIPWVRPGEASRETKPSRGSRIVLDRMEVWTGTRKDPVRLSAVEAWVWQAATAFGAKVIFDPFQAVGMMQRLQERRVQVEEFIFSSGSVGRLAATMHVLLRDRALALPDDPELLAELANVRLRETSPGVLRMDHDPDKHDDRAIALAMAAQDLLNNAPSFGCQIQAVDRRLTSGRRAR